MANNPYVNKVEYDGQTLMDLTGDTVTPNDVRSGVTFHDRSGAAQQGGLIISPVYDGLDSTSETDALSANQGRVLNSKFTSSYNQITTFESSWSATTVQVQHNSIVGNVRVNGLKRSATANGWVTAFQLPEGMRSLPFDNQYGYFSNDSGMSAGVTNVVQVRVTQDGNVQVYAPQANMVLWGSITIIL